MRSGRVRPAPLLGLALVILAPVAASGDLVIDRTVRDRRTTPLGEVRVSARRERVYVAPRRVLVEDLVFGRDLLVQLDRGQVFEIDRLGRRAVSCRFEDRTAYRERIVAELAEVRDRVAGTRQAEEIDGILGALAGGVPVQVRGGTDSARMCEREVLPLSLEAGGARLVSLWVAPGLPGGAALLEAYERLGWLPAGARETILEAGHVPLRLEGRMIDLTDRVERAEMVTRLSEEAVPAERYELPEGFAVDPPSWLATVMLPEDPPGGQEDADAKPEKPPGLPGEAVERSPDKKPERPERPDRGRR